MGSKGGGKWEVGRGEECDGLGSDVRREEVRDRETTIIIVVSFLVVFQQIDIILVELLTFSHNLPYKVYTLFSAQP